ncbi:restriction endonuclease [Cohnella boryungensis]|uniref:Restriction endonuclease n=1 Tax=Cohnella boryungensis TaxID=768479 RepID=A0ABV8SFM7_9BACL
MARRRKKQTDPVQALMGLLMLGSFFGTVYLTQSFIAGFIAIVVVFAILFMIMSFVNQARQERLKKSGIADIDKMSGRQFELYLGHLFKSHGYSVNVTQAAGDFGADLEITKDGRKIVVQAKRYSRNVGIKAVQEAQASIAHYGAVEAWVISNSGYTEAAITLAKSNNVRLIDREQLIEMSLKLNAGQTSVAAQVVQQGPKEEETTCNRCGSPMVLRKGSRGEFWGCSNFPKCRNIVAKQNEARSM